MESACLKPVVLASLLLGATLAEGAFAADEVKIESGLLQAAPDSRPTLRVFRGIPYAEPPVGDLRWKAPQPVKSWTGVRRADRFGARCMQSAVFADMHFRSHGMSEDCLSLNVWTPARSGKERLPVLVYFHGGGYWAGDGSEPRYDGAGMAGKGIVALTVNYRLGVFGFLAHPELTREAPYHASGNYGLLDQNAALRWVQRNIGAFGGDPKRVTIAGESAGSISVSAHVASPLSKDLIAGAIMESGSLIGSMTPRPLSEAEQQGTQLGAGAGASSVAALRALTAEQVLELTAGPDAPRFGPTTDGYLLPKEVPAILEAGEQAHVPLLGGSNSEEQSARGLLKQDEPTPENYAKAVRALYGDRAEEVLKLYPGSTTEAVLDSAMALAGDRFIGFSTWRFMEGHRKTGGQPVYRYFYAHPRPRFLGGYPPPPPTRGAAHSAEIEYAMGNLATNTHFEWGPADHKLSGILQGYFANFIKTGNPNGPGLPSWPPYDGNDGFRIMRLDVEPRAEPETTRARYLFLDPFYVKAPVYAPPSAARIAELSEQWVDPVTDAPPGTTYHLFETASRGKGSTGSYLIYLPPSYETETTRRYPVVYWLHGGFGNARQGAWTVEHLDKGIRAGLVPETIIVLPQALPVGWYVNSKDGKRLIEDVVIQDLIPHVDATYRTLARRESRGIEGMSMGGYGALHLGMRYPALFGAISAVAPAILQDLKDEPKERTFDTFGDDEAYYDANGPWTLARANATALRQGCAIRLLAGDEDARLRSAITGFHELLTGLGIPHQFSEVRGAGHVYEDIVAGLGEEAFAFWRQAFSASTPG